MKYLSEVMDFFLTLAGPGTKFINVLKAGGSNTSKNTNASKSSSASNISPSNAVNARKDFSETTLNLKQLQKTCRSNTTIAVQILQT